MRKFLLTGLLAVTVSGLFAQKLSEVKEKIAKDKYDEAKEKLDKVLQDPKSASNPEAQYYKGKVYLHYAALDSADQLQYNAVNESFSGYKRTLEIDPEYPLMKIDQNIGLFQLFDIQYNKGIRQYNNKNYDPAFNAFKSALEIQDYIRSKGFSLSQYTPPALDTQLVNLTGASAYLAKKEDQAIQYWEKLADAKIKDNDFKDVYRTVAEYHLAHSNQAKADKYIALGRSLFPDEEFWTSVEFGYPGREQAEEAKKLRDQLNSATDAQKKDLQVKIDELEGKVAVQKFARYEQLLQKYPSNYPLAMDYAIEYFNYTYNNAKKPSDYTARQEKTSTLLVKAISLDPNSALANYVMGQHLNNQIYDLEEAQRAIKSTAAADVAKRKDITAKINQKYDEMYTYAFKAYELYTAQTNKKDSDKVNLRKAVDQLIDYHDRKKETDKVNMYKQKLKTL
jgi:hypothetical protein